MYMYVCLCVYVMCTYVCEGKKKMENPLEWELEEVVGYLIWELETKLRASGRAASIILTHRATSSFSHFSLLQY